MNLSLPRVGGTYLLHVSLPASDRIQVGHLGMFDFPAGGYLYCGSAFGPGGLAGRLGRHLNPGGPRTLRWHIDYLRQYAKVEDAGWVEGLRLECAWVKELERLGGQVVVPGFGASDCASGCPAHLLYFPAGDARAAFHAVLTSAGDEE